MLCLGSDAHVPAAAVRRRADRELGLGGSRWAPNPRAGRRGAPTTSSAPTTTASSPSARQGRPRGRALRGRRLLQPLPRAGRRLARRRRGALDAGVRACGRRVRGRPAGLRRLLGHPPATRMQDEFGPVVFNALFTRDVARHEAELREVWVGPLCVVSQPGADRQGARPDPSGGRGRARLARDCGCSGRSGPGVEPTVEIGVVVDPDGAGQAALDERFGARRGASRSRLSARLAADRLPPLEEQTRGGFPRPSRSVLRLSVRPTGQPSRRLRRPSATRAPDPPGRAGSSRSSRAGPCRRCSGRGRRTASPEPSSTRRVLPHARQEEVRQREPRVHGVGRGHRREPARRVDDVRVLGGVRTGDRAGRALVEPADDAAAPVRRRCRGDGEAGRLRARR